MGQTGFLCDPTAAGPYSTNQQFERVVVYGARWGCLLLRPTRCARVRARVHHTSLHLHLCRSSRFVASFLCRWCDDPAAEFAKAMEMVAKDTKMCTQLGKSGRARVVKLFSFDAFATQLAQVVQGVLEQ